MNTELLLKVKKQILKEPRQFGMTTWFEYSLAIPNCNTSACIAGWAITLGLKKSNPLEGARAIKNNFPTNKGFDSLMEFAAKKVYELSIPLLDITEEQAHRLFSEEEWPNEFYGDYANADTPQERAEIAARRIDHFIATNGEE
jgi:hypothetical protein